MKQRGFSLIELMITVTVLTILTLGVLPLVKVSVKRQKEQQLRETLRQIRTAIEEFHRDTIGAPCTGVGVVPQPNPNIDPRSRVFITDCTIFGVDNPDRYPPDLETLVNGVNVQDKKVRFMREIPVDPMTKRKDWGFRCVSDDPDSHSWCGKNVFDVYSNSHDTGTDGRPYSEW